MESFRELALKRQSCRNYDGNPVPDALLNEIVGTALLAPSARNLQPWKLHIVTGDAAKRIFKEAMADHGFNAWGSACPALIVIESDVRANTRLGYTYDFPTVDAGILMAYITLAAAEKGLGTCIVGAEDEGKIKQILGISDEKRIYCSVAVGWPADTNVREKSRKAFEETVVCRS